MSSVTNEKLILKYIINDLLPTELISHILSFISLIELYNMKYLVKDLNIDKIFINASFGKHYSYSNIFQFTSDIKLASIYGSVETISLVLPHLYNIPLPIEFSDMKILYETINDVMSNLIFNENMDAILYIINIISDKKLNYIFTFCNVIKDIFKYNKYDLLKYLMDNLYNYLEPYFNINFHSLIDLICEYNDNSEVMELFANLIINYSHTTNDDPHHISYNGNFHEIIGDLFHLALRCGRINCVKVLLKYKHLINIKKYTGLSSIINKDIPDDEVFLQTLYRKESTMMQAVFGKNINCIKIILSIYKEFNIDIREEYEYSKSIEIASSHGNKHILLLLSHIAPYRFHTEEIYNLILSNALSNINYENILFVRKMMLRNNIKININKIIEESLLIIDYKKSIDLYTVWGLLNGNEPTFDFTLFWEKYFNLPDMIDEKFEEFRILIQSWI